MTTLISFRKRDVILHNISNELGKLRVPCHGIKLILLRNDFSTRRLIINYYWVLTFRIFLDLFFFLFPLF